MTTATLSPTPDLAGEQAPAASQPAVSFEAVTKRYDSFLAVSEVSFAIERGTLVTLLGPSGCGKTTTLRMVAGLETPSGGRIRIEGQDVTLAPASERDVSMVFQSYALFPHMTVMENVCYGLRASGMPQRKATELAADKLAMVGLSGFENRLPSELSGGQQQRVAVARAVVLEPKVLLFDEPLSNLDAKMRRRVREDIRALQQQLGLTVLYVTHDQEEALAVSDRIIVMRGGKIAQDGTPRALYQRPADRFIADFIGNANVIPVNVTSIENGMAEVAFGGAALRLAAGAARPGPAELAVRPQAFGLAARLAAVGELSGEIRKAAYLGSHMEYSLAIAGVESEVFVIDHHVDVPLAVGAGVAVSVASTGATLLPHQQG